MRTAPAKVAKLDLDDGGEGEACRRASRGSYDQLQQALASCGLLQPLMVGCGLLLVGRGSGRLGDIIALAVQNVEAMQRKKQGTVFQWWSLSSSVV